MVYCCPLTIARMSSNHGHAKDCSEWQLLLALLVCAAFVSLEQIIKIYFGASVQLECAASSLHHCLHGLDAHIIIIVVNVHTVDGRSGLKVPQLTL